MSFTGLIMIAIALGIDAFAVAAAAGTSIGKLHIRPVFRMSFHFGLFQAFMPIIGWYAGVAVYSTLSFLDHWIAFGLLAIIGVKMIMESRQKDEEDSKIKDPSKGWSLVWMSIATSIDALAVGLSLAMLGMDIRIPAVVIGVTAALLTLVGMTMGMLLGNLVGKKAEAFGGIVLICIGIKILAEHMA